ncbi:MAG: hypothetical protein WBJ81_01365 [Rickettsiales bacterium]
MTDIYKFGPEAASKCRSEPEYKEAINKFLQAYCPKQKTLDGSNDLYVSIADAIQKKLNEDSATKLYNCNPFVHQVYAINDECPDGYTQIASNTLADNNLVNTCMGIISDATTGESLNDSNCFAEYYIK